MDERIEELILKRLDEHGKIAQETHDGVLRLEEEAKRSWRPAAEQAWRNKAKLDVLRGEFQGSRRTFTILVLLLTAITLIIGIVQAVRAFAGA